jgi:hypothetical protein
LLGRAACAALVVLAIGGGKGFGEMIVDLSRALAVSDPNIVWERAVASRIAVGHDGVGTNTFLKRTHFWVSSHDAHAIELFQSIPLAQDGTPISQQFWMTRRLGTA